MNVWVVFIIIIYRYLPLLLICDVMMIYDDDDKIITKEL